MKLKLQWCLLVCILYFSPLPAAQNDFTKFNYTYKNGLPQSSIKSMVMDSSGFLWLSSEAGLLRFDGINFKEFNKSNDQQIIGNYFSDFFQTASGKLIATDVYGGLYLIENGKPVLVKPGNLDAINYLEATGVFPDVDFYVKYTTPHLRKALDTSWHYPNLTIFSQSTTQYTIRTKNGLAFYNNGQLENQAKLDAKNVIAYFSIGPEVFFMDSLGNIFNCHTENGVISRVSTIGDKLPWSKTTPYNQGMFFYDYTFATTYVVSGLSLYALRNNEQNNRISVKLVTDELPANCIVRAISYHEKRQVLAIATDTKGLFIYKTKKFKTLVNTNPAPGTTNGYYSQLVLDSNRLLTDWRLEFDQQGAHPTRLPIVRNIAENIFRDRENNVWYSNGDTLLKYNPANNKVAAIANFKNNRAVCFFQSGDSILIGTLKHIYVFKNDSLWQAGNISSMAANANPFTIFNYGDHRIWFSTIKGLFIYNPQTQVIDTVRELYRSMIHNTKIISDYLFIGTYGNGYYLYKNGKIVSMPLDKNKYLLYVHTFFPDNKGMLWMTTNRGLFKCSMNNLIRYFNDTTTTVRYHLYSEPDGIQNTEFNGGCTSASVALENGYVSLPTMDGLVWFRPSTFSDPDENSPVIIDEIYLDDKLVSAGHLTFASTVENIRITFSSPYWGNPDNLEIEYKLDGLNKTWKHLYARQNSIEFSRPKSGNYTLIIRKQTGLQSGSYTTTSLSFYVDKKFYETWWFLFAVFVGSILLIISISRIYARNIKKRNKILEESVRQRTAELSIANEQLQHSVNDKDKLISIISHDVVTPLRFIAMVARKSEAAYNQDKTESVKASLEEIKKTSEKLFINAQNILNWIKHHNKRIAVKEEFVAVAAVADDVIDALIELAAARNNHVNNNISPDDILKTDENILGIVLHNLLTNAIKFTENGVISFNSTLEGGEYCISVSDTGFGINPVQLQRINQIISHSKTSFTNTSAGDNSNGLGYIIITELTALINSKIKVHSSSKTGTLVVISFPADKLLKN